jgi:glycine hydroxymethyltransferase
MGFQSASSIEESLRRQNGILEGSLILTPVDSFPIYDQASVDFSQIEGLYATDRPRERDEIISSKIFFAGRDHLTLGLTRIYASWSAALGAADVSMRLLSGLHAHIAIFMGLGKIGDTVMLLPELGGGHFATSGILQRLGFNVIDIPVDIGAQRVDRERFIGAVQRFDPDFVFIDRSEGLIYEDFAGLFEGIRAYTIFDASQYLPGILTGQFRSPFDMGFDLLISTLHKSFPGPQKALVATRYSDERWKQIKGALSSFVSSFHLRTTYLAGLTLASQDHLNTYASRIIDNAVALESALALRGVPVIRRPTDLSPTHHVWIQTTSSAEAYRAFHELERCRIQVNYRLLPYELGYGLRLGTAAATVRGMQSGYIDPIADIIAEILRGGFSLMLRHAVRRLTLAMRTACDLVDGRRASALSYDGPTSVLADWDRGEWSDVPPPPSVHSPAYRESIVTLLRSLHSRRSGRLLSLGSGNAFIETVLASRGFDVLATDSSLHALTLAREKGLRACYVDALAAPSGLGHFNIVYADGLVGHALVEPRGAAYLGRTLTLLTEPGGFVVLANDLSEGEHTTTTVTGRHDAKFFRGPPGEVERQLLRHLDGFRLLETRYFEFERPGRGPRVREVLILARTS